MPDPDPARSSGPTLVLATRNRKKGEEMRQLIQPAWEPSPRLDRLVIRGLDEFPDPPEVVEDADTFAGNARKKASEPARALGHWVLADDSGLVVEVLGGAPGVLSARYAGAHGDDEANNRRLLGELREVDDEHRNAAFVCALALSDPSGTIRAEVLASCRGRITHEPRGRSGFGYDPLFLVPEYHKTFGELGSLAKHQLSHRARAFERIRPLIETLISSGDLA